jgi:probable O-glycosylation ligase (exosortase A-associated)
MLRTLFVLIILIPGLAAALASRFAALLVYLWFSLFRPQDWLWIDITSLRLSFLLSLLVVIPRGWLFSDSTHSLSMKQRLAREAWPNLTHPLTIGMALFYGTALVAQVGAVDPAVGWLWLDYLWRVFLVSMVAVSLINTRERFLAVLMVMTASFGFHSTKAGITSLLVGGVRYEQGLGGAFGDNNGYAMAIVMILPFLVAVGQNAKHKWLRWAFLAAVAPSLYTIVSTFSRAGFLAAATVVLVFAALQRRRVAALSTLVVVALLAFLVVPIPKGYLDRLETIQTYEQIGEESALSRLHFWKVAVDMVRDRPGGIGLRNYDTAYDRYDFSGGRFGNGRSVHSSHFQVLAENGFAGFAIWAGLFLYAFLACLRIRMRARHVGLGESERHFYETMANALIASMVGFIVGGAFIALALNDLTWLTFALVAALDRLSAREVAAVASDDVPLALTPLAGPAGPVDEQPRFTGGYRSELRETAARPAPVRPDGEEGR